MLTSIRITNFKKFTDTEAIPLGQCVVFIGPNNSGKTTALQALTLWHLGITKWMEKRGEKTKAKEKTGVPINRKDVYAIPTPSSKYLWNNLITKKKGSKKIVITIEVEGILDGIQWHCGMDFDYFGDEVLYCRPSEKISQNAIREFPEILKKTKIAFLPPMSGLVPQESKLLPATVNARIGEGRTAEVLRNLCYFILNPEHPEQKNGKSPKENWLNFSNTINGLFGIKLNEPQLNERGEIEQSYLDENKNELDLSSAGRGLQQVMLLFSYMFSNPHSVLLLDEPDAHLEILRQRMIYNILNEQARENGSQIIAASHSEIVLQEAANKDTVIAFLGKPHRINDKGSQVMKSLTTIGFDNYYLAELKKWILYLEGSSDLAILKTFAKLLKHDAEKHLQNAFVHYVAANVPQHARDHFYGLKEAVPALKGIAVFDRIEKELKAENSLTEMMWKRREIENYIFSPSILIKFAKGAFSNDLFGTAEANAREIAMDKAIRKIVPQIAMEDNTDEYWIERKASEELDRIFREYFKSIGKYNVMDKNKFFELAELMTPSDINSEIKIKLDKIAEIAVGVN
ncbi:MAG: ATP-binding protein [Chitinophagales bacterium]|nr:ATP-binding protein [Chitinophagales bacterium]